MRYWNRNEVAVILGVSQARVSQIAREMKIKAIHRGVVVNLVHYKDSDVEKMKRRKTKRGPEGNSNAKRTR